jgi:lipopolysaccharide/colanic/teichoic acid biosynthesis glycosyltransferase
MYRKIFKRIFDVLLSSISLILLIPVVVPVSCLLLLTGEHEVFYFQNRLGHKNRRFKLLKLATMKRNSQAWGSGTLTVNNDPRVTPVGRILRKTKINELPQLIHILKGTMSFVGPRPQPESEFMKFPEDIQRRMYDVKPGLTGIGSIIFRDEEKLLSNSGLDPHFFYRAIIAPFKGELELWYQDNLSFMTDMKLIFCTVVVLFFPHSNFHNRIFKGLPPKPAALSVIETGSAAPMYTAEIQQV